MTCISSGCQRYVPTQFLTRLEASARSFWAQLMHTKTARLRVAQFAGFAPQSAHAVFWYIRRNSIIQASCVASTSARGYMFPSLERVCSAMESSFCKSISCSVCCLRGRKTLCLCHYCSSMSKPSEPETNCYSQLSGPLHPYSEKRKAAHVTTMPEEDSVVYT